MANLIIVINKVLASSDRVVEILQNKEKEVFEKTALEKETLEKETSKKENSDKEVLSKKAFDKALGEKYISFKNVSFRYNKKSDDVLSDISFGVEKGSTVGIIGGTGCGKTTLINLLSGFYEADTGEIIIEGKCVNDYQEDELHSMFGIVPQKAVLFSGTIRDNIKWGKQDATDEEILQAIEAQHT